jgi:hypothetical protein
MMKEKKEGKDHDLQRGTQGAFRQRTSVMLRNLACALLLAIALSSLGLASGSATAPDLERSKEASAMRWERLGEAYQATRADAAAVTMTNRYQALAAHYGAITPLAESGSADSARWIKLGEAYTASHAEAAATAMTSRYKALAEYCNGPEGTSQVLLCSADYGRFEP